MLKRITSRLVGTVFSESLIPPGKWLNMNTRQTDVDKSTTKAYGTCVWALNATKMKHEVNVLHVH